MKITIIITRELLKVVGKNAEFLGNFKSTIKLTTGPGGPGGPRGPG